MIGEFLPLGLITGEFMAATGLFGAALSPIPIGWKLGWRGGSQGRSLSLTCLTAWGIATMISALLLLATVALIILPIGPPIVETSHVILRVSWVSTLIALIPAIVTAFITYFFAARHRARKVIAELSQSQPGVRHAVQEALPVQEN
ncbi:MAG: hypothetical protein MK194_12795 [Roseibacillus sp.]|nr:hypothetical protein [Roseibacillus sp.]